MIEYISSLLIIFSFLIFSGLSEASRSQNNVNPSISNKNMKYIRGLFFESEQKACGDRELQFLFELRNRISYQKYDSPPLNKLKSPPLWLESVSGHERSF